jgi:arsenate reductase-like glutaredoxin family protein
VKSALGGFEILIDTRSKEYDNMHIKYMASDEDREEALLANPAIFKTPIVRNGSKATVGFAPEVWKAWE